MKKPLKYVIHRHQARHLHYDLRLEREGVLKSWAVPKGMPEAPGIKRLAVEVEDHPLGYFDFEGVIPEGQYGAGKVEVWDSGTYVAEAWDKGRIEVEILGKRLSGRYALILFKERSWLVMKLKGRAKR
ncbi:MAG TPA: ATP-dependent DNA ligase [Deltaproteobacteria bacterium]|nr:MAG: ATP-dependent DNA ligase [Deltaproteobacteria bacterium GWA2_55_82]OGQ64116.1 MAG: ATP-dependent DNA ligase [Deltaproteobacteria bacterium RIFCSPLOWO2_02_FULL_55_12]OIJ74568.1 MAG: ATP-dependent DNA ligase [Deltaproteobacteria bacterium GWC2_55_46]HBG46492.1 ATP-dependent DNA ligase [Deltaproteobacteria bacterium]HCY10704.1 ATP-dependent DNA ligase [Deltaproteobacteria bacterium]